MLGGGAGRRRRGHMTVPTPEPLSRAAVRELDRIAIEEYGLPGVVLMENAGAGAARIALALLDARGGRRVAIACGPGNNGGDGWVVARYLANAGCAVRVATCVDVEDLRGDALVHARVAVRMGVEHARAADGGALARLAEDADLVVDALLGTGASGAPRGAVGAAVAALAGLGATGAANSGADRARIPILALDLPSGFDADTGARAGACVRASVTATFAAPKVGFRAPGAEDWLGRVEVVDLGVPRAIFEAVRARYP